MTKRMALVLSVVLLVGIVLAGCSKQKELSSQDEKSSDVENKRVTINIFLPSPDKEPAYSAIIEEYKNVKPHVTVNIESTRTDYPGLLKAKIASGDAPDIFGANPGVDLLYFKEHAEDLSNLECVEHFLPGMLDACYFDGKLLAIADVFNSTCVLYNKKLFQRVGINEIPKTFSKFQEACKKLEANGITPFTVPFKEWWIHKHIAHYSAFVAAEGDNDKTIQLFLDLGYGNSKFSDYPRFTKYFDIVDFLISYGMPRPLEIDYTAAIIAFSNEQVAMFPGGGDFAELMIKEANPEIEMGLMGLPLTENRDYAKIGTQTPTAMIVNKNSKVLSETKEFINWLYSSEFGKGLMASTMNYISTLKDAQAPDGKLAQELIEITNEGNIFQNGFYGFSGDAFNQKFGETLQNYIAKVISKEEAIAKIDKDWPVHAIVKE